MQKPDFDKALNKIKNKYNDMALKIDRLNAATLTEIEGLKGNPHNDEDPVGTAFELVKQLEENA